ELQRLARDVRAVFAQRLPPHELAAVLSAIAVAGTATSAAAMDQALDPYDPTRVHGYVLSKTSIHTLLERTAAMTETHARSSAGRSSCGRSTSSPCAPSASTTWS